MKSWTIIAALMLTACATSKSDEATQEPLVAPSAEPASGTEDTTTAEVGQAPPKDESLTGSLAKEEIRAVIRAARDKVRYCYEKELQNDRSLAGKVTIRFIILPDGSVADGAQVTEATLENRAVQRCLIGRVEALEFPEPEGGGSVAVNYPFNFTSGE